MEINIEKIAEILKANRLGKDDFCLEEVLTENHALIKIIAIDILEYMQVHHKLDRNNFLKSCGVDLDEEFKEV